MVFSIFSSYDDPPSPKKIDTPLKDAIKADVDAIIAKHNLNKYDTRDYTIKKPLIVHCCHHKTGTVVIEKVLRTIAPALGLKYQYCPQSQLEMDTDIWLEHHSKIDFNAIDRPIIGTHMIRNPCAIIVSAYEYHKNTIEPWANRKIKSMDGITYREILNKLSLEEGIIFEMKNDLYLESSKNTIMDIYNWDYRRPNFLELKFEDLMTDYDGTLSNMFKHYGFTREMINTSLDLAKRYNLRNKKSDDLVNNKHVTNKNMDLDKWKNYFKNQEIIKRFWKIYPDDIFNKIGYIGDNLNTLEECIETGRTSKAVFISDDEKMFLMKEKKWKKYNGENPFLIE